MGKIEKRQDCQEDVRAGRQSGSAGSAVRRLDVIKVIEYVRSRYPEDIFPPDGKTLDCKSAKMARLTCDNIRRELDEIEDA